MSVVDVEQGENRLQLRKHAIPHDIKGVPGTKSSSILIYGWNMQYRELIEKLLGVFPQSHTLRDIQQKLNKKTFQTDSDTRFVDAILGDINTTALRLQLREHKPKVLLHFHATFKNVKLVKLFTQLSEIERDEVWEFLCTLYQGATITKRFGVASDVMRKIENIIAQTVQRAVRNGADPSKPETLTKICLRSLMCNKQLPLEELQQFIQDPKNANELRAFFEFQGFSNFPIEELLAGRKVEPTQEELDMVVHRLDEMVPDSGSILLSSLAQMQDAKQREQQVVQEVVPSDAPSVESVESDDSST